MEVYRLSRKLSEIAWTIYGSMDWKDQRLMGNQFVESTDSACANIAESYGRYHFLDKMKFLYYSRGSYFEARKHWLDLLYQLKIISTEAFDKFDITGKLFLMKLNNYISSIYQTRQASI